MARAWDERHVIRTPHGTKAEHVFKLNRHEMGWLRTALQELRSTLVLPAEGEVDALTQGRLQQLVDLERLLLDAQVTIVRDEVRG